MIWVTPQMVYMTLHLKQLTGTLQITIKFQYITGGKLLLNFVIKSKH